MAEEHEFIWLRHIMAKEHGYIWPRHIMAEEHESDEDVHEFYPLIVLNIQKRAGSILICALATNGSLRLGCLMEISLQSKQKYGPLTLESLLGSQSIPPHFGGDRLLPPGVGLSNGDFPLIETKIWANYPWKSSR
ncbi:hypothetical protein AVEN_135047-1 [Araneus ventricosus]|uniref:Uncharacterized protein n=1 Tax=Araneus ventricosus TaxID=182803 RepID=A0A4Y2CZK8_ARAVE|nr:hypothetical protein AVEN_135047-1 [Araneus ventricosus]